MLEVGIAALAVLGFVLAINARDVRGKTPALTNLLVVTFYAFATGCWTTALHLFLLLVHG